MSEVPQDNRKQLLASEELIAQAYAAISSSGRHGEPPAPTGAPVSAQAPLSAKPASATKSAASRPAAPPTASRAPSLYQQAQAKTTAGPKAVPAGAPYHQPVREHRSSSPFQPPPPTGAPASPLSKPIAPSRQTMTTGPDSYNPSAPRPIHVDSAQPRPASQGSASPVPASPVPASQRPAQQTPQKKKSGGFAVFIWFIVILFLIFVLPYLYS